MGTERKHSQAVVMTCTLGMYVNHLLTELQELGYNHLKQRAKTQADMGTVSVNTMEVGRVSWGKKEDYPELMCPILKDFNAELFLAIAAMSEGQKLWNGEIVIAEQVEIGGWFEIGNFYRFAKFDGQVILMHDLKDGSQISGGYQEMKLRKATVKEIMDYFSRRDSDITDIEFEEPEVKPVIPFKYCDHVTGMIVGNGMKVYGHYLEGSMLGGWHYIMEEGTETIHACERVEHVQMVDIPIEDLIKVYAHVNKIHHLTIRAKFPEKKDQT